LIGGGRVVEGGVRLTPPFHPRDHFVPGAGITTDSIVAQFVYPKAMVGGVNIGLSIAKLSDDGDFQGIEESAQRSE
jgi:hypothetical protein